MSTPPNTPAVFRALKDKVPDEVIHAFRLLFDGLTDNSQAIRALNSKHESLSSTVTTVSATAAAAQTTANQTAAAQAQPVAAGQNRVITANDTIQQTDHIGAIVAQGTSALTLSLNPRVQPPWKTRLINQSTQPLTLSPLTGSIVGSSTVASNTSTELFFDGTNWTVG